MSQAGNDEATLVLKLPLGNPEGEALASQDGKLELSAPNSQAGTWELAELPQGWLHTNLGSVADYGKVEKAEANRIADDTWVLELEDIERDSSKILQRLYFRDRQSKSTKNKFKKGDVLYGKLRPYLNKVVVEQM